MPPVHVPLRPVNSAERRLICAKLKEMQATEFISPSKIPCSLPGVLVKKKDECIRFGIDYQKLNEKTKPDTYFGYDTVKYRGHIVREHRILPLPDKIKAAVKFPSLTSWSMVHSFQGLAGYYRRFI